jgi:hypothetical protein
LKDLISFPSLVDQFIIKRRNVFPIYLFMLSFGFISCPKFSQSISPVDHYSFSSVLRSFPNLLVHVIMGFHQFFPPISWVYHDVSWVLVARSFIVSLNLISLPHISLHCTIHFHPFSPTYLWFLTLVTRFYPFSPTTCSFYHWGSPVLPIHSLILSLDFNQFSPSICSFSHSVSSSFPRSSNH